jgi:NAD(P)H-dependent FMN reductase
MPKKMVDTISKCYHLLLFKNESYLQVTTIFKYNIESPVCMRNQALKVAIILGSTRPGRNGEVVSHWIYQIAKNRSDANFELIDIKDYNLPLLDEPIPPSLSQYSKEHTKTWSLKINSFDAFIFVTAEYNHGIPGALKNAIDFLFKEWNNKVAGFVSYGSVGGVRAVEQLRLVMAELKVATVRAQVALSLFTDFENFTKFKPSSFQENSVKALLDEVIAWGGVLKILRTDKNQDPT